MIQWPLIHPRSVADVEALLSTAGVPAASARAHAAEDGVYAVYVLHGDAGGGAGA